MKLLTVMSQLPTIQGKRKVAADAIVKIEIKTEGFVSTSHPIVSQKVKCENDSKDCDCLECSGLLIIKGERIDKPETIFIDGLSDQKQVNAENQNDQSQEDIEID